MSLQKKPHEPTGQSVGHARWTEKKVPARRDDSTSYFLTPSQGNSKEIQVLGGEMPRQNTPVSSATNVGKVIAEVQPTIEVRPKYRLTLARQASDMRSDTIGNDRHNRV